MATKKLQVVVMDLAGPMRVPTPAGGRFFLVIKDKFSSYKKVYILAHKNDALESLKNYVLLAEKLVDSKIEVIRSDKDTVFCSQEPEDY